MAKLARVVLVILVIMIVLLVAGALLLESRWARSMLEDQISQKLDGRPVQIGGLEIDWGFPLGIQASNVQVANPDWAEHDYMLTLDQLNATLKVPPLFTGDMALGELNLQNPVVHLARREDGTTNWEALIPKKEDPSKKPPIQPDLITIRNGHFTYQDQKLDADLSVDVRTEDGEQKRNLLVEGRGSFQGKPFKLDAQGGAPSEALEKGAKYPISVDASLGDMRLSFEGQSLNVYTLEALHGELEFIAPDQAQLTKLSSLFEQPWLTVPTLKMQAQLSHEDQRWALKDFEARAGSSEVSGSAALTLAETPRLEVDLESQRLNLNEFGLDQMLSRKNDPANRERGAKVGMEETAQDTQQEQQVEQQQGTEEPSWDARMANLLSPLRKYAGTVDAQVDELILGDARLDELVMKGTLDAGRLNIEKLHAVQDNGALDAQGWVEAQENTIRADINTQLEQFDLGQTLQPFGLAELGIVDGELHGKFDGESVRISDTELSYDMPEEDFHLQAQIVSRDVPDTEAPGLHVEGQGTRRDESFRFNLTMGPLLDLKASDHPYPVEGTLVSGETKATIDGTITQPLDLKAFDIQFNVAGPNPADLNAVTGLELPDLPEYEASGRMRLEDELLRVTDLRASVGRSDISGDIRVDFSGRPMVWANLYSNQLNTRDVFKAAKAADKADEQDPERFKSPNEVFDHEPLDLQMLGSFDAELRYRADNLIAKDIPLSEVVLDASLDEGILTVTPLSLGVGGGTVEAEGRLNAVEPALQGNIDLSMMQVNLGPLLKSADLPQVAKDSAGIIGGKGSLRFEGESIAELMAGLDGTVELAMSGGYLDMLAIELVGLDVGESLVSALTDDQRVPLRCTYVKAVANDGLVTFEQFYVNTADTNFTGGGTVNLASEQIDLVIKPHPKDFSLLSADTPVQLQGTLANPKIGVQEGSLIAKGAASLAGALIAPPLAILPWIEPGTGEGSGIGCREAMSEFEESNQ